jgi:hypothetical protein
MQEIIRRCDMPVKRGRETVPHGEVVSGDLSTQFALEGTAYEADLCDQHRQELRDCLAPFISVSTARPSRAGQEVRRSLKGKKGGFTTKDVRKWLQEQGREVADSGRLPNEVIEEYRTAHAN